MSAPKLLSVGVLAFAFAVGPADAGPASSVTAMLGKADVANAATQVQWRRGGGWRRGWGPGPWIGLGAGVAAGLIIADRAYRPRPGYYYDDYAYDGPYYYPSGYGGDPRVLCAQNFRSFEWNTGLYTTYGGEKRLCPYLR